MYSIIDVYNIIQNNSHVILQGIIKTTAYL